MSNRVFVIESFSCQSFFTSSLPNKPKLAFGENALIAPITAKRALGFVSLCERVLRACKLFLFPECALSGVLSFYSVVASV